MFVDFSISFHIGLRYVSARACVCARVWSLIWQASVANNDNAKQSSSSSSLALLYVGVVTM